jgi:large subunit ribosomal protein L6
VKGKRGELQRAIPDSLTAKTEDSTIILSQKEISSGRKAKQDSAIWGTYRSLVQNMVQGVSDGFQKVLEFQGIGYKAAVKGKDLELSLGFSHPVLFSAPDGVEFKVEKNKITISGVDKQKVGQIAAEIRAKKPPEPYKGSGIKYLGEVIRRKAGKKATTSA